MGPHDYESVAAMLQAQVEQFGIVAGETHALLAGALAANQLKLQDLRDEEIERRSNYTLLGEFVDSLPQVAKGGDIEVQDANQARQVQANVLWLCEPRCSGDTGGTMHPYYIIGTCTATEERHVNGKMTATHVLLFSAGRGAGRRDDSLRVVTVRDDEFSPIRKVTRRRADIGEPFDNDRIEKMFNPNTYQLRVGHYARDETMQTRLINTSGGLSLEPYRVRDPSKVAMDQGIRATNNPDFRFSGRLEDVDLGRFDVLNTLNGLALDFGKQEYLAGLFEKYRKEALARVQARAALEAAALRAE